MKVWTVVVWAAFLAALSVGCNATSRYRVLSFFFDGVPPPEVAAAREAEDTEEVAEGAARRKVGFRGHGPFAAKLCDGCHKAPSNELVVPIEQLCFRCHELGLGGKYVHGPLSSGGCRACHDPHGSQYRYLLVSESDSFCFYCHERQDLTKIEPHESLEATCTACHDAHMSDTKYLLK